MLGRQVAGGCGLNTGVRHPPGASEGVEPAAMAVSREWGRGSMVSRRFDPKKLAKLNDPKRLRIEDPELIWQRLDLTKPEVLVDLGAGTGFFAVPFREKLHRGVVYACDVSAAMIAWMDENLPERWRGSIVTVKTEETGVPLPDAIADLVYMIDLHHELRDPALNLAEAHRLLKKGGKVAIIDWKKEESPYGPPLAIRVTAESIDRQLRDGGFSGIVQHDVLPYHHFFVAEKS
jgi:ubiquinone/menaquinone biosynthesis C-methylase UbiE